MEQAWLRPRYNGYMYFQDVGGTIINEYLKSNNSSETAIDQLIFEFEKSFFVNKK